MLRIVLSYGHFYRCAVTVGGYEIDSERHLDVHVALDAFDGTDEASRDIIDAAVGLWCGAVEAYNAGECGHGQWLVGFDTGDSGVANEYDI